MSNRNAKVYPLNFFGWLCIHQDDQTILFYQNIPIRICKNIFKSFYFFKDFIDLFLERGEGREIERERNINGWLPLVHPPLRTQPATQTCVLTGNRTGEPLVRRPALYPLSHTSQGTFLNLFKSHSQQELVTKKYFLLILHSELTGSLYESLLRNKIKF